MASLPVIKHIKEKNVLGFFYVKTTVKVEGLRGTETTGGHSVATLQKIHQCHDNYLHLYKYNVLIFFFFYTWDICQQLVMFPSLQQKRAYLLC